MLCHKVWSSLNSSFCLTFEASPILDDWWTKVTTLLPLPQRREPLEPLRHFFTSREILWSHPLQGLKSSLFIGNIISDSSWSLPVSDLKSTSINFPCSVAPFIYFFVSSITLFNSLSVNCWSLVGYLSAICWQLLTHFFGIMEFLVQIVSAFANKSILKIFSPYFNLNNVSYIHLGYGESLTKTSSILQLGPTLTP